MNKEEIFKEIKNYAKSRKIPIILDDALEKINELLIKEKPTMILEIGTAVGYSAICFAKTLNNMTHIDTIEIEEIRALEAIENVKNMNFENSINVIFGDAVEVLKDLKENTYDFVFIDAAKGKYTIFLEEAKRLIKNGGIIVADNILYKGMVLSDYNEHKHRTAVRNLREYIQISQNDTELKTEILDIGDGLAISRVFK